MKFMKLGSKPDGFVSDGSCIRYVVSELPTDVTVHVGDVRFRLHKFPLLSKSSRLQRLILKASEDGTDQVFMHDFPSGPKAFEMCAKFCYGMSMTLNAYNVLAARCAAEYLEMTELVEKGNFIFKIEVFLNSSVLRSWKDMIIVLQSTQSLKLSEEPRVPRVAGRCIDSISSKISVDPLSVNWSYTYRRKWMASSEIVEAPTTKHTAPKDWWIEDICELDVDLYKRVMVAVKSKGRISSDLLGDALKAYAVRWLPDTYDALVADDYTKRYRILAETIVSLLPSKCSCKFLLKLLKVVIFVGSGNGVKDDLMDRISLQLHKASVKDLLVPAKSTDGTAFDVSLVQSLVSKFLNQVDGKSADRGHGTDSLLMVGKLIDDYLIEIAADHNLLISSFVDISESIPGSARPNHDGLYTAIDIYLKKHPLLTKAEKKRISGLMDVQKLSVDFRIQAAQNELLPLRVIVQILFFEQQRISASSSKTKVNVIAKAVDGRVRTTPELQGCFSERKECGKGHGEKNSDGYKDEDSSVLQPSRSRKIIDKLWFVKAHGEPSKLHGTSGTTPCSLAAVKPEEARVLSSPSAKNRRYSVS